MSSHIHTGTGMPDPIHLQKMYWAAVGSVIGAAAVVNLINHILLKQRLNDKTPTPAKPRSVFFSANATLTALFREASNATPPSLSLPIGIPGHKKPRIRIYFPPFGPLLLVLLNLCTILILALHKLNPSDQWSWEDIGYRTGFMSIVQLPLLFLLSSRRNLVTVLTNTSYAQLNYFHRWIARTLWLSTTIHMGFWFRSWGRYNYILYQLQNNGFANTGFAAWCVLTVTVVSSFRPIRKVGYEGFLVMHLVSFVGFLVAVWFHAHEQGRVWVWVCIGLLVFDRVVRYLWAVAVNVSIFCAEEKASALRLSWKHRATFTPLPGNVSRVSIDIDNDNAKPKMIWNPGQYMFLTCHAIAPLQSHPFTIASIPEDKTIEFLIRAEKGGTKRFLQYAQRTQGLPGPGSTSPTSTGSEERSRVVLLEGPYGTLRPLCQFETVVFIAGGMGATFTVPLLRDIAARWRNGFERIVTRRVRFVWVVRSRAHLVWFETQLRNVLAAHAAETARLAGMCVGAAAERKIEIRAYVTGTATEEEGPEWELVPSLPRASAGRCPGTDMTIHSTIRRSMEGAKNGDLGDHGDETSTPPDLTPQPGRPPIRKIIRPALESATGESAVVACGPQALADEVRRSVVSLSDERAVHKGTGAQGVYLHVERFGW